MANSVNEPPEPYPTRYLIRIKGKIREDWSDWFSGMDISRVKASDDAEATTLTGMVSDQAALRGILCHIWDLNLTILSISQMDPPAGEK